MSTPLRIFVPRDAAALSVGAEAVAAAVMAESQRRSMPVELVRNGSRGLFWLEPLVEVETPAGRVLLGEAVVVEVTPELAKVVLNGPASQATGPRFVLLKEKGLPAVVSAPVAAKPVEVAKPATEAPKGTTEAVKATPAAARMSASLKLQRAPRWQISVTNTSNFTWANCSVFIPGQRKWVLKSLSPTFIIDMPLNYFQPDPAAPLLNDEVEIRCAQGSVRLSARE